MFADIRHLQDLLSVGRGLSVEDTADYIMSGVSGGSYEDDLANSPAATLEYTRSGNVNYRGISTAIIENANAGVVDVTGLVGPDGTKPEREAYSDPRLDTVASA